MTGSLAAKADLGSALADMWRSVLLFVPKFLAFLAILIIGWLVARVLLRLVNAVLERVRFDRLVERGGLKSALSHSRLDASDIVAKIVYYAVLLFTLQLAFGVWGPNPVSDLIKGVVAWLPKAFVAIVIVVIATAIARAVREIVSNALGALSYGRALANVASWFIIGLGVIAALNQIGVATTVTTPILIAVLATIAGILVIGVGGGLVRPMQQRWEHWLDRAAEESQAIAEHAKAYSAAQAEAEAEAQRNREQEALNRQREAEMAKGREAELARQHAAQNAAQQQATQQQAAQHAAQQQAAQHAAQPAQTGYPPTAEQPGYPPTAQQPVYPSPTQTAQLPTQPSGGYPAQRLGEDDPTVVIQPIDPQAPPREDRR